MCEDRTNNSDTGLSPLALVALIVVCLALIVLSVHAHAATLPDPVKTPGASFPGVISSLTKAQLCAKGFTTKKIRDVTEETKAAIYKSYGATDHQGICNCPVTDKKTGKPKNEGCEVDHLVAQTIHTTYGLRVIAGGCGPRGLLGLSDLWRLRLTRSPRPCARTRGLGRAKSAVEKVAHDRADQTMPAPTARRPRPLRGRRSGV
jgi:hypothetical protein